MTRNNVENALLHLSKLTPPEPDEARRRQAMTAALNVFDARQNEAAEKNSAGTQGLSVGKRLTRIIISLRGNFAMATLLKSRPVLGLMGTTALVLIAAPFIMTELLPDNADLNTSMVSDMQKSAPQEVAARQEASQPAGASLTPTSPATLTVASDSAQFMPVPAPETMMPTFSAGDQFPDVEHNGRVSVAEEPVSTFSADVDTASYSYVRSMIQQGIMPPPEAVRIEELINYFDYDYRLPESPEAPFEPTLAVYPTPWNSNTKILHIGIKGYEPPALPDQPVNLVFLIDTSGSMNAPNKLPLLKQSFALLLDQLRPQDTIAIATYAGSAGIALETTPVSEKSQILNALDNLVAGGSTAGAQGIELAYRLAQDAQVDGVNRVILATDGDFNVGISDPQALEDFIARKRERGVSLSVLGFGQGNLGDDTMQALAQNGNGVASYISSIQDARKVLADDLTGTLFTIAGDVKFQVEFNPALVSEYRLIGYETRALKREDFNNDAVDAGDVGAGHTVTALYEIVPAGSDAVRLDPLRYQEQTAPTAADTSAESELGYLKIRYKQPGETVSQLIEAPISTNLVVDSLNILPDDIRFAASVAAFGEKLRNGDGASLPWSDIRDLAANARGEDPFGYRSEFMRLIDDASVLGEQSSSLPKPIPVPADPQF